MKKEEYDGTPERKILIGMIVNDVVAGRAASKWKDTTPFRSRFANIVGKWAVNHHLKYKKPIGKDIELKAAKFFDRNRDAATAELISNFLGSLSGEYESHNGDINAEHLIDEMADHWDEVAMERVSQGIQQGIEGKNLEQAREAIAKYSRIDMGPGSSIDLFMDQEALRTAYVESEKPLIEYKGPVGQFFGNAFRKGGFVGFLAGEKATKSFWLEDVAYRAMRQKKKVGFIQAGDMTLGDVEMRFAARAASWPTYSPTAEWPYKVQVPLSIKSPRTRDEKDMAIVDYEERVFKHRLPYEDAWKAYQRVTRYLVQSNKSHFKFSPNANWSVNVNGIRSKLAEWERVHFVPDVLVIDYADVMDDLPGKMERRDAINKTWSLLRSLSQDENMLVVTATQANRDSYTKHGLNRTHLSEDKRKLSHCTDCFGINMTAKEKEAGICRLNNIGSRMGSFSVTTYCYVAGCLAFANPCMKSCFFEGPAEKAGDDDDEE